MATRGNIDRGKAKCRAYFHEQRESMHSPPSQSRTHTSRPRKTTRHRDTRPLVTYPTQQQKDTLSNKFTLVKDHHPIEMDQPHMPQPQQYYQPPPPYYPPPPVYYPQPTGRSDLAVFGYFRFIEMVAVIFVIVMSMMFYAQGGMDNVIANWTIFFKTIFGGIKTVCGF